ncbi:MAG: NAD(P)H-quinone oxidoreductase, partial [Cyclobacteriaceae bacterium]
MRIISISNPGGPEVLRLSQRPIPTPSSNELLIHVSYAGVNRPDIAQRKGKYPAPPGAPADIPGLEVSGTVESTGTETTRFKPGDQVCALLSGGGYAEYVTVPEGQCLPLPKGFSLTEAAALPETVFTVWHNVFQRGQLKPGEILLVHGGTSGIGVMAIQLAIAAGATVITTAGTDEKCKFCEQLGAVLAINYKKHDFTSEVLNFTKNKGVDVILDMVGGAYTQMNLDCLDADGRLVLINFMSGDESTVRLSSILRKRLTVTGSTLRARDAAFKKDLANEVERMVWP